MNRDLLIVPLALVNYVTGTGLAAMGLALIITDTPLTAGLGWLPWTAVVIGTLASIWTWGLFTSTPAREQTQ